MSSKDVLLEVAMKEFMIHGYQKTSLSKITSQIGISKPALYYYYPNKKSLFLDVIDKFFTTFKLNARNYETQGTSCKDKIKGILKSYSDPSIYIKNNLDLKDFNHLYFIFDAVKNVPEVLDLYKETSNHVIEKLNEIIKFGIDNKEIRQDLDVEAFIYELGLLIEGIAIGNYVDYALQKYKYV